MRPFKRKSRLQQVLTTVKDGLPSRPSDKTVKTGLIAAGGLAGLTAGSAGVSSLRRRGEQGDDDS
jgi:hypothetical protein